MIDPSIALQYRPAEIANPMQSYAQAMQLRNLAQQQQMGQMEIEEKRRALAEQDALRQAYRDVLLPSSAASAPTAAAPTAAPAPVSNADFVSAMNNGSLGTLGTPSAPAPSPSPSPAVPGDLYEQIYSRAAASGKVSPLTLQKLQEGIVEHRTKYATMSKTEREAALARNTAVQGRLASILAAKDDAQLPALWKQRLDEAVAAGDTTAADAAQHPYPGSRAGVEQYAASLNLEKWSLTQQQQATADERKTQAANATTKLNAELPGVQADAAAKARQNYATMLAGAGTQAAYDELRGKLPFAVASTFPAQYDRAEILKRGMTPDQITTTEQAAANAAQTATRDANTVRHEKVIEGIEASNARNNTIRTGLEQNKVAFDQGAIVRTAHALASGDLTRLKDLANLRGDQRLQIYDLAKQENPSFNLAEVDRKIKMEDWLANGKGADNLQSFGTFLEHAGAASDAVNAIRNASTPAINKPLNWWRQNMSGAPEYTALAGALEPVRQEAENFLKNGHAQHKEDIEAAHTILNENASPAQLQAALKVMGHTAQARFTEMNQRYSKVQGHDIENPFSPEALAGAAKIGLKFQSAKPAQTAQATPSQSAKATPTQTAKPSAALPAVTPGSTRMVSPDGTIADVPNTLVAHYSKKGAKLYKAQQ